MKATTIFKVLIAVLVILPTNKGEAQNISLAGKWRFAIDRNDKGILEKWFNTSLSDNINLPGSMAENLKGDDITLETKWTGSIYDSSFFFRPSLAKYRQPQNVKILLFLPIGIRKELHFFLNVVILKQGFG